MKRSPMESPDLGDLFEFDTEEGTVRLEVVRVIGVVQLGVNGQPIFQVRLNQFAVSMANLKARYVGSK